MSVHGIQKLRSTAASPLPLGVVGASTLALLMVVAISLLAPALGAPVQGQAAPVSAGSVSAVAAQSPQMTYTVHLPLVARLSSVQTVFGVQMADVTAAGGLDRIADAPSTWVGGIGIAWSQVEEHEGDRNWLALGSVEEQMLTAATRGLVPIVNVRFTPGWAQMNPPYSCGPVAIAKLGAFAAFMHDLVARYSQAPYNIKYWEIGNEPDVDPSLVSPDSPHGCWGDAADYYYGGGQFGNMLEEIYPAIKAADPQAQVLVGGLLLDCDPALSSCKEGKERPARFLEGILHAGAGAYFDGVSFHAYDYYSGTLGGYNNPSWQSAWNTTGPAGIAKSRYLTAVLSDHGAAGKFLMDTELALLCDTSCSDATFEDTKAAYLAEAYAAAIAEGWRAGLWYSALGWRNSGLLSPDLSARTAYFAYRTSRSELQDARLLGEIVEYAAVKGYVFDRGDRQVWLLWSKDGADHAVSLPFFPSAVRDVLGNPLDASVSITVTLRPVYVER
jgi:hypothetical protein